MFGWWFGRARSAPSPTGGLRIHSSPPHVPFSLTIHWPQVRPHLRFCASPWAQIRPPRPRHSDPAWPSGAVPALEGAREVAKSRPHFSRAWPAAHPSPRARAAPAGARRVGRGVGPPEGGPPRAPPPRRPWPRPTLPPTWESPRGPSPRRPPARVARPTPRPPTPGAPLPPR